MTSSPWSPPTQATPAAPHYQNSANYAQCASLQTQNYSHNVGTDQASSRWFLVFPFPSLSLEKPGNVHCLHLAVYVSIMTVTCMPKMVCWLSLFCNCCLFLLKGVSVVFTPSQLPLPWFQSPYLERVLFGGFSSMSSTSSFAQAPVMTSVPNIFSLTSVFLISFLF